MRSKRSYSAEGAAALRAAGTREPDPVLRNPDHLAERFIGRWWRVRLLWPPLRRVYLGMAERLIPGVYRFVTVRTKHIDEMLRAISGFAAGSSVVFDYLYREGLRDGSGDPPFVRFLRRQGEPVPAPRSCPGGTSPARTR